ncbi:MULTISPECIES: HlyD family secretion protein [unclassified Bradyrhizobium]|uniref:efflux RND transporter periplasmic adaptor subunit n=1 Tax=unclassified Bradyrhizobium TaxID=2631580 RepID=UPI00201390DE|nr:MULTISPECIES: HlyD family secretion protein [unclassified Bradyrhizobium]
MKIGSARPLVRILLTLAMTAATCALVALLWREYVLSPWTRDGRVSAEVVQVAPEVSGTVAEVRVADNQRVRRGDVLYVIDPERFRLALDDAEADLDARERQAILKAAIADRRRRLQSGVVSAEDLEQTTGAAAVADADARRARAARDLARLNLARATVRAPVDGFVTNLRMRPGDYATAGVRKLAVLDADSFWITGYFEETKLRGIGVGDVAEIRLMGNDAPVRGHVESIGHGIADANDSPDHLGLPSVNPVFSWVRLAQRIPVRIHIDDVPHGVQLAAGMTCSVAIRPHDGAPHARGRLVSWLHAVM